MSVTNNPSNEQNPDREGILRVRNTLIQLSSLPVDLVESESVEIKGWCSSEKDLTDKVSEAVACIANAHGGIVLIGIEDHAKGRSPFSPCPYRNLSVSSLQQRISDLTMPSVACSVTDASDVIADFSPEKSRVFAVLVPKSRTLGGHLTTKGVSKIRVGKECRPQFTAEDDRTKIPVPFAALRSLSKISIDWAAAQHAKKYKRDSVATDGGELLSLSGLLISDGAQCPSGGELVSLGAILLFGTPEALKQFVPYFETHIISAAGTSTLRENIVDSIRKLFFGSAPILPALVPSLSLEAVKELVVNAYVHRCYRTAGPVIIRLTGQELEIESPGELPAGLSVASLIHCVPVYRNLLLAEATRIFGLSDKIGQGIDIAFRGILRGGFPIPEFESEHGRFSARIPIIESAEFREFVRRRSQALDSLDEIIVLRVLWAYGSASADQILAAIQRGREFGSRVLGDLMRKLQIEQCEQSETFRLTPIVRQDIENIFKKDQLSFPSLWD